MQPHTDMQGGLMKAIVYAKCGTYDLLQYYATGSVKGKVVISMSKTYLIQDANQFIYNALWPKVTLIRIGQYC